MARILVTDDETDFRRSLAAALRGAGHDVAEGASGDEAIDRLQRETYDLVMSDLRMPGPDGLKVLREAAGRLPDCLFVVMTAYGSLESAIEALRIGVHDYLVKPMSLRAILQKVELLLKYQATVAENRVLRAALEIDMPPTGLVGGSNAMREVHRRIAKVAGTDSTVLILGETGTGKELVAKAIHSASPRHGQPFVAVNCGSIPDALLESELFGHVRGSFTGADRDKRGLFEVAGGGTIFLDEVGELPLPLQPKLLRALEAGQVLPVGATVPVKVRARIVAATNRALAAVVAQGGFRPDLYYRLNVFEIRIAPLRDRPEDIRETAQHLLGRLATRLHRPAPTLDPEALRALEGYRWPGNVRELANVLERALILSEESRIQAEDLQIRSEDPAGAAESAPGRTDDLAQARCLFERAHVRRVLEKHAGSRTQAAKALGISLASLYRKLQGPPA